ncbi:MAG: 2-C-methyl-D-erythritol 4-phosphate cytidylyltransferase [Desulfitobacteriaceae bacterium]
MDSVGVIIPAAGQGTRMGAGVKKQFITLTGLPIFVHTVSLFQSSEQVQEIVVVGAAQDIPFIQELVRVHRFNKVKATPIGGKQRQESVFAGLKALSPTIQTVVVHDGARPLLTLDVFHRFLAEAAGAIGAVTAVQLKDTVKLVDKQGWVVETPLRDTLRAVQTPQVFKRSVLEIAHHDAQVKGFRGTDDASLLEWLGYPVRVLEGSPENIKITTPEDLWLAERILEHRISNIEHRVGGER